MVMNVRLLNYNALSLAKTLIKNVGPKKRRWETYDFVKHRFCTLDVHRPIRSGSEALNFNDAMQASLFVGT